MKVKSLKFQNFRNLEDSEIFPCDGVNIIYGDNAQGKTNIIEALWLFCGGHSFRPGKDSEFIQNIERQRNDKMGRGFFKT